MPKDVRHLIYLLEQLQSASYKATGKLPHIHSREELLARSKHYQIERYGPESWEDPTIQQQLADNVDARLGAVRTKYEHPTWYAVISPMVQRLETIIDESSLTLNSSPLIGTVAGGQVNAMTMQAPHPAGGYLILMEEQLFLFASLFSKAIARALPVDTTAGPKYSLDLVRIKERIRQEPSVLARFVDVVSAYARTGEPGNAKWYLAEPIYDFLSAHFLLSMEYFVLGHEYGHLLAGHLETAPRRLHAIPGVDMETLEFAWAQEYEADYLGVQLSVETLQRFEKTFDFSRAFIGADLFFSCMDVMDRAVSLLRTGDERTQQLGSHPPAHMRRAYLRDRLPATVSPDQGHLVDFSIAMGNALCCVVDELWALAKPLLMQARSDGAGAWEGWRTTG